MHKYGRGNNARYVVTNGVNVYYSYSTPVGFLKAGKLYVRMNKWGPTTARHIKDIPAGDTPRVGPLRGDIFESMLADAIAGK